MVPGSHLSDVRPGDDSDPITGRAADIGAWEPPGAIDLAVAEGTAVLFDRRTWHSASRNFSNVTRKVIFMGYVRPPAAAIVFRALCCVVLCCALLERALSLNFTKPVAWRSRIDGCAATTTPCTRTGYSIRPIPSSGSCWGTPQRLVGTGNQVRKMCR